jgi:methionine-rich copper-binding protein CopC
MKNIQFAMLAAATTALMISCRNDPSDTIAPTVVAFAPAENAQNVYLRDEISVTFSEAVQPSSWNH